MTDEKDDYTINDYISQNFGILIGETWTCLTYHTKQPPKILNYDSFIIPLREISHKEKKWRPIIPEKKTHLQRSCVTMTYLMVTFYKN